MSDQSRITVLLGAGAALEIGAPSTGSLTEVVRLLDGAPLSIPEMDSRQRQIMAQLFQRLEKFYGPKEQNGPVNFEDIFHAIEQLISLHGARQPGTVKAFKPVLAAFTHDDAWLKTVENYPLYGLLSVVRHIIGNRIHQYCKNFTENKDADWFRNFWHGLGNRFALDIATLNYDNLFEQMFSPQDLTDGYANNDECELRFSPETLSNAERHRLMHLHGSILFGWPHPRRQASSELVQDFHALYKFNDYDTAIQSWKMGASENHAQSGDMAAVGPLITGLRKTDKLLSAPYVDYNHQLYDSLRQNERLLIIGYGFGDYHINVLLKRMKAWHGDHRRIVVIDYIDDIYRRTWSPHNGHFEWASPNLFYFFAAVASEPQPFPPHGYRNPNRIGSDLRGLMFFEGFKQAAAHLEQIADFFSS